MNKIFLLVGLCFTSCATKHKIDNDFCHSKLKSLTFHKAYSSKPKGWSEIFTHRDLIVNPKAEIDNKYIRSLKRSREGRFLEGQLTSKGKEIFSVLTKELAEKNGFLVIKLDQKIIADPKVQAEISSGRFHIILAEGLMAGDLCKR